MANNMTLEQAELCQQGLRVLDEEQKLLDMRRAILMRNMADRADPAALQQIAADGAFPPARPALPTARAAFPPARPALPTARAALPLPTLGRPTNGFTPFVQRSIVQGDRSERAESRPGFSAASLRRPFSSRTNRRKRPPVPNNDGETTIARPAPPNTNRHDRSATPEPDDEGENSVPRGVVPTVSTVKELTKLLKRADFSTSDGSVSYLRKYPCIVLDQDNIFVELRCSFCGTNQDNGTKRASDGSRVGRCFLGGVGGMARHVSRSHRLQVPTGTKINNDWVLQNCVVNYFDNVQELKALVEESFELEKRRPTKDVDDTPVRRAATEVPELTRQLERSSLTPSVAEDVAGGDVLSARADRRYETRRNPRKRRTLENGDYALAGKAGRSTERHTRHQDAVDEDGDYASFRKSLQTAGKRARNWDVVGGDGDHASASKSGQSSKERTRDVAAVDVDGSHVAAGKSAQPFTKRTRRLAAVDEDTDDASTGKSSQSIKKPTRYLDAAEAATALFRDLRLKRCACTINGHPCRMGGPNGCGKIKICMSVTGHKSCVDEDECWEKHEITRTCPNIITDNDELAKCPDPSCSLGHNQADERLKIHHHNCYDH